MKTKLATSLVCLLSSLPIFAMPTYKDTVAVSPWASRIYMGAYGGYGTVNGAIGNDGNVAQGRLSLGVNVYEYRSVLFGAELAVQSGNTMRLDASSSVIEAGGGLPIQSTLKPLVDLLVAVKGQLIQQAPLIGILKAGIAYRQLELNDRTSSSDNLQKVNGELQLGLGYELTQNAMLTLFYQGIYSDSNAGVSVDATGNNTFISNIPTQQAGFLGIEYKV